ncbi:MAG: hypothetical protein P4L36_19850 [Holophaga sp.]|nr:hypothetical protein [Holophaga sp.]
MSMHLQTAESEFSKFLASVSSTHAPLLSPSRFSKRLNWPMRLIAERAHVHRNTVARTPGSPAVQAYLRNVLRVLRVTLEFTDGDINRSLIWFQNCPIAEFGYQTADELVTAGETEAVVNYLESIASGSTG